MTFIAEIWFKMQARYTQDFRVGMLKLMRVGFKGKKADMVPYDLVEEMVSNAYLDGVRAFVKMQQEVDHDPSL